MEQIPEFSLFRKLEINMKYRFHRICTFCVGNPQVFYNLMASETHLKWWKQNRSDQKLL
jgi:hypothetical protein